MIKYRDYKVKKDEQCDTGWAGEDEKLTINDMVLFNGHNGWKIIEVGKNLYSYELIIGKKLSIISLDPTVNNLSCI